MATGPAAVVLKLILAAPPCSESCVLLAVTGLPMRLADCSIWLAWVSWINWVRSLLVLICCCTEENCTSSVVNWLASIGEDGSWFLSCVINNDRKSVKLLLRLPNAEVPFCAFVLVLAGAEVVAEETMLPLMTLCPFCFYTVMSKLRR